MTDSISRRNLIRAAGLALSPAAVLSAARTKSPSEKLNIAGVGVGAMGGTYLKNLETENIAALCDVDSAFAARTFERYPKATRYRDYRELLDKEKDIDAVVIGTPDHTHAAIALAAMQLGKHVYCAKPMTRTVAEARSLAKAAREGGLATQMSVQSSGSDASVTTAEWVRSGVIGKVREVHVWSDRPVWPQGLTRPAATPSVPETLDWTLWLGSAPPRPYHPLYHPFNWRGWVDFGTGALGDMGCHTLHVIVRALDLGNPVSVEASSSALMELSDSAPDEAWMRARKLKTPETFPAASIVTWQFPGDVRVTWYDGGLKPPRPSALEPERKLGGSGILFHGTGGTILSGFTGKPSLVPASRERDWTPPEKTLPRVTDHYGEWVAACKGGKPASCNFEFGAYLTELTLLGAIAQRTGRHLVWDAAAMRFPNDAEATAMLSA